MNKVNFMTSSKSLQDEYKFIQQLQQENVLMEGSIWEKFCGKSVSKEDINKEIIKFNSHPKRIMSDSESSPSISPRRLELSSGISNLKLDNNMQRGNAVKNIHKCRKKLHSKLTNIHNYEELSNIEKTIIGDNIGIQFRENNCERKSQFSLESGDHGVCLGGNIGENKLKPCTYSEKNNICGKNFEHPMIHSGKHSKQELDNMILSQGTLSDLKKVESILKSDVIKKGVLKNTKNVKSGLSSVEFSKKFKITVEKCLQLMNDISALLENGIPEPDGDEDFSRRLNRVKEFSSRFGRNYLYPLVRQIDELSQPEKKSINMYQKVMCTYQLILQGLQAYYNHLPSSVGNCSIDKLKTLLKHLVNLCGIHDNLLEDSDIFKYEEIIKILKMRSEMTLEKIDQNLQSKSVDSILRSNTTKTSLNNGNGNNGKGVVKSKQSKTKMETRFSMYSATASFRKDLQWKKTVENLAKKKFNVKSRYKNATYKHRPAIEKPRIISGPSKNKLFPKRSSFALEDTPHPEPTNEDNITTMVQIENQRDEDKTWEEKFNDESKLIELMNHGEIAHKLLQLVQDNDQGNFSSSSLQEKAMGLKKHKYGKEITLQLVKQCWSDRDKRRELTKILDELDANRSNLEDADAKLLDKTKSKRRKEPKITITGEKNARLICITDENSILEFDDQPPQEEFYSNAPNTTPKTPTKEYASSETQTELKLEQSATTKNSKPKTNSTVAQKQTSIKISRLPKSCKSLQVLPKDYAINIIQYKLQFHKHCKGSSMYRKTTGLQPWSVMGKISDEVLNHALLSVAQEIEVNDIIDRIYQSELQLE